MTNPFAVMVGDDFMIGDDAGLTQLVRVASEHDMPVIGVMEVPADKVNRYGIVMGEESLPASIILRICGETSHRHGGFPPSHCGTLCADSGYL